MTDYKQGPALESYKELFLGCTCLSPEHQMVLGFYTDEEDELDKELYVTFYLSQWRSFFKRVWVAVRYVFGYKSRYGEWDCINFDKQKANELTRFIDKFLES